MQEKIKIPDANIHQVFNKNSTSIIPEYMSPKVNLCL